MSRIPFIQARFFNPEETRHELESRFSNFLQSLREAKSPVIRAVRPSSPDFDAPILVTRLDQNKITRRTRRLLDRREAATGLRHLEREYRNRLAVLRDGAGLIPIANDHHADELASALHTDMPWMAPATEIVWHAMRRSVREGWPGLRLPPLLLDGPPGIGKSHWARRLGELLSTPTTVIEATGENASFGIVGSQRGWSAACPGRLIETVLQGRMASPVMVVDEVEKAGTFGEPILQASPFAPVQSLRIGNLAATHPAGLPGYALSQNQAGMGMSDQSEAGFRPNLGRTGAAARIGRYELVLAFLLIARLVLAAIAPVTDTTEARYADMARMMVETGDWITPQIDYGVPFWGKPPLFTWLSAAGIKVFGPALSVLHTPEPIALAARLPILGTALALLWLLYRWIAVLRGRETALIAAIVLSSSALFFGASAFVMTDMPLALGIVLAMVGFHRGVGASGDAPDRRWGLAFFGGLAVGLMAKGPVAVVLVGIPLFLWLMIQNRWRLPGRLPWLAGTALLTLTVLPWYVAAEIKTPGFLHYFFVGEHFQRFVVPNWQGDLYGSGHERAKGMIWLYGMEAFLPWLLFLPVLLWRLRPVAGGGLYSYLGLFMVAPMILFTPAANILAAYVLPGMPAAAALMAIACCDLNLPKGRLLTVTGLVAAFILPVFALGVFLTHDLRTHPFRTAEGAVRALTGAAPDARIWTLGDRIYSAEFYTDGRAQVVMPKDLPGLLSDDHRDAVIVTDRHGSAIPPEGFQDLGRWTIYRLWIEPPAR